ncbi:hypothetical protein MXD62_30135 [Frankia sp. Mgl5]|uniref:hypothetical protein n=1 Tax=Frankia sp. Mgl5 TaxID=2933793 RepID=UPI00200FCCDA|nr:hypothetical protein [Frankia sp. Mgl5]MCK9931347.1 hypothetical protein [Frankia sp. Mgl5]
MADAAHSPESRAEDLIQIMTIEEKAQQVTGLMAMGLIGIDDLIPTQADRLLGGGIGHLAMLGMAGQALLRSEEAGHARGPVSSGQTAWASSMKGVVLAK